MGFKGGSAVAVGMRNMVLFAAALAAFLLLALGLMAAPAWAVPALTVEKTDDPDPVAEGNILTYTVDVENTGTDPTDPVQFSDDLPDFTTFVSVATTEGTCPVRPAPGAPGTAAPDVQCELGIISDGQKATITIKVRPTNEAAIAGTITNIATAADGTTGETDEEDTTVTPNLSIVKEDSPGRVEIGDRIQYLLTVRNKGASNAGSVVVRDELPDQVEYINADPDQGSCDEQPEGVVVCDLDTIDAGGTVRIRIIVDAKEAGTITNTASVLAGGAEEAIDEDSEDTVVEDGNVEPTTPEPTNPEPQNPEPQNPEPQNPEPQNPEPQNPEPQNPGPQIPGPGSEDEIIIVSENRGGDVTIINVPGKTLPNTGGEPPDASRTAFIGAGAAGVGLLYLGFLIWFRRRSS